MNEFASAQALEFAKWVFGGLLALLGVLAAVIRKHDLKQHEDLKEAVEWMQENHVSKEILERVERTFRDAMDEATSSRREMHKENQKGIAEIKDSVTGVHRRIDEEFRFIRSKQQ